MKHETQKISRIANVLVDFFLSLSAKKIDLSIDEQENFFEIIISSESVNDNHSKIEDLKDFLKVQRQEEIEEYYWQLVGNDNEIEEINLIGMMVDEAVVEHQHPILKVKLIRYK